MTLPFVKMTGAGNDFILADNRNGSISLTREQVAHLCHRQLGIGADGLMLLVPARNGRADWAWQFWNSDGSDAEMCGNGARCFARYIQQTTAWTKPSVLIETAAGIVRAEFQGEQVTVNLTAPRDLRLRESIQTSRGTLEVSSLNTGVPHAVVFWSEINSELVRQLGAELRWHPHFQPRGTNVNFVQIESPDRIRVRTYERGVEGETLACGTGVSASAMITAALHGLTSPVRVLVQGGDELRVRFARAGEGFSDVQLIGPATFVFAGTIELPASSDHA